MEREPKVRIAQTRMKCFFCGEEVKPGHPYVFVHVTQQGVISLVRSHPECRKEYVK